MNAKTASHNGAAESGGVLQWDRELQRFVEAAGNTTHAFGLGRMIGRMFAILYLSPHALALEDIASRLSISKASASTVVRQLASWRAVRQVWIPGDRRDFYEAETSISIILREGLLPGMRKKIHSAGLQIDRSLQAKAPAAQPEDAAGAAALTRDEHQEIRRRLRAAQAFHKRLDRILSSRLLEHFI